MKKNIFLAVVFCCVFVFAGCTMLGVKKTAQVEYANNENQLVRTEYYSLTDGSLHFVKLYFTGGETVTLPQGVSASGARYTNDFQYVWWIKGDSGWLEKRDDNGDWVAVGSEFTKVK